MYQDLTGKYRLMDFHMSHSEMIFRNHMFGDKDFNVDVMFKGVLGMNMITTFKGLTISAVPKIGDEMSKIVGIGDFLFKLEDTLGATSYINASAFGVFKNRLGYAESSLGDFTWSVQNELLFWSHDHLEFTTIFNERSSNNDGKNL